jgi:predicted ribonuclease YlaK
VAHLLDENADKYEVVIYGKKQEKLLSKMPFAVSNDARILASALSYSKDIVFVTNDICLKCFTKMYLPNVESIDEEIDTYKGYKEVEMTEEEMDNFYSHFNDNLYNLYNNEYLIIRNTDGDIIDRLCWTEDGYRQLNYSGFYSTYFGNVKVKRNDPYQAMLADSFLNNQITMVKGPAGSGKTYLSLAYLLHLLYKHKIDKIIIFCNTVATKGSAKLGYYPGSRDEKLLDS